MFVTPLQLALARSWGRWVCAWCLLLVGCATDAGTPCQTNYECSTNSCSLGTCDGLLSRRNARKRAQQDADEAAHRNDQNCQPVCGLDCQARARRGLSCDGDLSCVGTATCSAPCEWLDPCAE